MNNHPHNCKIATMVSVMKRRNMEIKGYNLVRKVRNISWRKMTFKLTSTINWERKNISGSGEYVTKTPFQEGIQASATLKESQHGWSGRARVPQEERKLE